MGKTLAVGCFILLCFMLMSANAEKKYSCRGDPPGAELFIEEDNPNTFVGPIHTCTVLIETKMNWIEGLFYCKKHYSNSYIDNVVSEGHMKFLKNLTSNSLNASADGAWISANSIPTHAGNDPAYTDKWKVYPYYDVDIFGTFWGSNSKIGQDGYPNRCGFLKETGKMKETKCTKEKSFFCHILVDVSEEITATSGGDNDPHFLMDVKGSDDKVCFDFFGEDGDVVQLLHDEKKGLTVNAKVFQPPIPELGHDGKIVFHKKTYFDATVVIVDDDYITASINGITINNSTKIEWNTTQEYSTGRVTLALSGNDLIIMVDDDITFNVKHHEGRVVRYLGIFLTGETLVTGLSPASHGLLGQFVSKTVLSSGNVTDEGSLGTLEVYNDQMDEHTGEQHFEVVTAQHRYNQLTHKKVECWMVDGQAEGIIDGTIKDYYVSNLYHDQLADNLQKYTYRHMI